jgi:hypothetical protein
MNIRQAQQEAIEHNATDTAEFDIANDHGSRSHCRWEDAEKGIFRVLDGPTHLRGKTLTMIDFDGEVENFIVPANISEAMPEPIAMILYCPQCLKQHVDKPQPLMKWTNPPHRSHQCQYCGCVWRPADVPTVGVERIETTGKRDTWVAGKAVICAKCRHDRKWLSKGEPTAEGKPTCGHGREYNDACGCHCIFAERQTHQ